ncbi:LytR C-terminal domain-containing protein [Nocardia sp. NPDC051030]|uniref:LytR C-terminal domain-containing protein n=1 Tax=Nocardia sp. NPDC051030 TaxID=3155162 RepID=UPI003431819F
MSNPISPSGGPPLRALAMVLIALAIVFAGLGAMSLSSSDSSSASETSAAPSTTVAQPVSAPSSAVAPPVTTAPAATTTPPVTTTTAPVTTTPPTTAPSATSAADKSVPVRVYNNGVIAGLAAQTGGQLTASGWNVTETGNYATGVIPKTTVYYGSSPGEQAAAVAIAKELGVTAEPRFPGIADSPPGVIVIVTGN